MKKYLWLLSLAATLSAFAESSLIKSIEISTPLNAPDDGTYWMQARAAVLPEYQPPGKELSTPVVITLQKTDREGTHMYHGLSAMWTDTLGKSWYDPAPLPQVDRIIHTNGVLEAPVDMTPQYHQKSGKVLVTGATFWQDKNIKRDIAGGPSDTAYSVFDFSSKKWSPWKKLAMPDGKKFHFARAGCSQRVDLPDGDILLPIYFRPKGSDDTLVTVVRCKFDGTTLSYLKHGTVLSVTNENPKIRKGLHEPSLTKFGGKYLLTLRNDERGYVSTSDDGLNYTAPKRWTFDDGKELGSYNTQQHWVTHSDGLFLAYTRRGADNDKVFRNRAPLFLAKVDPKKLVVERATEQILLPNLGKAFGNFGVCNINAQETWVVDCLAPADAGKPNLYIAKINWAKPNRLNSQ